MRKLLRGLLALTLAAAVALPTTKAADHWWLPAPHERPNLSGVWQVIGSHPLLKTAANATPPLLPAAKAVYERNIADRKAGDMDFDPTYLCLSPGMPRLLTMSPFRIIQTRPLIAFIFKWNHRYRQVLMNRPHGHQAEVEYLGDATGKWRGDTLRVDSVEFTGKSLLDEALPHSSELHLTEQYRLVKGGRELEDRITIEDPETFSRAWTTTLRFVRLPDDTPIVVPEDVCTDRQHVLPSLGGPVREKPAAPK